MPENGKFFAFVFLAREVVIRDWIVVLHWGHLMPSKYEFKAV